MLKELLKRLIDLVGIEIVEKLAKKYITVGNIKKVLDQLLDVLESGIEGSKVDLDDKLVLPVLTQIRMELGITEEEGSLYHDEPKEEKPN